MEGNINEAIEQISEKLGLAISDISQLMPQVVKEHIIFKSIETGVATILAIVCAILLIFGCKYAKRTWDGYDLIQEGIRKGIVKDAPEYVFYSDVEDGGTGITLAISGAVGIIIFALIALMSARNLIGWVIAPEASFLEYVASFIK